MLRRAALHPFFLVVTVVAVLSAACSSPPQKERDQADSAITAAKAADAELYAPDDLKKALTSVAEYDSAVSQGDYRLALGHAISARDFAYTAARLAGERKAALRGEADRLIVDFGGLVIMARTRVGGAPALPPAALARTKNTLRTADKRLQEAGSLLEKQDFKGVVTLLQPLVQTLKKDLAPAGGRRGRLP